MKKLLLLLCALLAGAGGAWADVTQPTLTTDTDNPVYYAIKNCRSNAYATYVGASSQLIQITSPAYASLWYFVENGEGVSIVPAADPSVKLATNSSATTTGAVWYLKENTYNSGYFCISLKSDLSANCWDDNRGNVGYWNPRENDYLGTSWIIELASNASDLEAAQFIPSIPEGKYLSVGTKATSFTVATSGDDNAHWYLMTQTRGGETPIYNASTGSELKRAATSVTPSSLENASVNLSSAYLVRFISAGDGLYNLQFANGDFVNSSLVTTPYSSLAGKYVFYNTVSESTTFGWNLNSREGAIVNNNGAGNNVVFWSTGEVTWSTGNDVWSIYPVAFTDAIVYPFNTTNGAFFSNVANYQSASDTKYANLWLSKASIDRPQVKMISAQVAKNGNAYGNNMRSTGGLYTTASSETYTLSVSEGKITSYTIVGTAQGELSITPAGGSAETFSANASVSKKVTLATPAKQTNFTLTGESKWLDVDKFIIEYESDATIVESLSEIVSDGIYTLTPHNAERGVMYVGSSYLDACGGHAPTNYPANPATPIDVTDVNQQFVFYAYNSKIYLYNVGSGKFVGVADDDGLYYKMTGAPINAWTLSNGAYDNYFHLTSQADSKMATINAWIAATATNKGMTISSGKDYAVTGTTADEEANNFLLMRVGTLTSEQQTAIETIFTNYQALQNNLTTLGEYTLGSDLCQYTNTKLATDEEKETVITNVQNGLKDCNSADIPGDNTRIQELISGMSLNIPNNQFIKIKGVGNRYLTMGDGGTRMTFTTSGTILFYSQKKIISYSNGLYAGMSTKKDSNMEGDYVAVLGSNGMDYTFTESTYSPHVGKYKIGYLPLDNVQRYMYATNSEGGNADQYRSNDSHDNCVFVLEAVKALPVTFFGEYASFYSPVDLTIPAEGVEVYTGKLNEAKTVLTLNKVEGTLPANTGVILKKTGSDETVNFPILSTATQGNSDLLGTVAAKAVGENSVLVLGKSDDVWGIYNHTGSTLAGFKAYMEKTVEGSTKGFGFVFADDTDGITVAEVANQLNGATYNLSGQRVLKPTRGLYIVGGKKILVK